MQKISFFKNISYALVANIFNAFATIVTSLLLPKVFDCDIESYGFFQIYFFYVSYVGFFHFGLCDGILLRIGGCEYSFLDKKLYSSQFWILCIFEIIVALGIIGAVFFCIRDTIYRFIYSFASLNLIVLNLQTYILYLMQGTSRIKEYSFITSSYRAIYCLFVIVSLIIGYKNVYLFVAIDLFSKFISLLVGVNWCRDIIFSFPISFIYSINQLIENIKSGIKLLTANISNLLTNGIVRIGIQSHWSVVIYGKVSLSLTLTLVFMTFVNAISLVLYPTLRRVNKERFPDFYFTTRDLFIYTIAVIFIFYYPIALLLEMYLPQYSDSITFLSIIMPLSLYSVKSLLIVSTLLKVLRMEKMIMYANITSVITALVSTLISIYFFDSLTMAILAIVINTIIKCVISDIALSHAIGINIVGNIIEEIVISATFIVANWIVGGNFGVCLYIFVIALLIGCKRNKITQSYKKFYLMLRTR